jgi:hypothetical protein
MRAVDLDDPVSRLPRATGGGDEIRDEVPDLGDGQLMRHRPAIGHRDRRGSDRRPWHVAAREIRLTQRSVTEPRPLHAGLAPGMAQLDRRDRAMAQGELGDPCMAGDLAVGPETRAAMGDAPAFLHRRRLGKDDARPADRETAQMH